MTKRTSVLALAVLATLSLSTVGPGAHAATGDEVIGNYVKGSGEFCARQTVDARTTAAGTSGTVWWVQYRCDGSGYTGRYYSGTVTCLAVTGNTAALSGSITSSSAEFSGLAGFLWRLQDNSTPSSPANPDRESAGIFIGVPSCTGTTFPVSPILAGDIRVSGGGGA